MAQKRPNLVQNLHFWSFWAKYCHFSHLLSNARPKTIRTRCLGGFSVIWVTKLLISPVKKRIFCPKRPNFIQCPIGGSVGGCGARAVSRKTPIYFIEFTGVGRAILSLYTLLLCKIHILRKQIKSVQYKFSSKPLDHTIYTYIHLYAFLFILKVF